EGKTNRPASRKARRILRLEDIDDIHPVVFDAETAARYDRMPRLVKRPSLEQLGHQHEAEACEEQPRETRQAAEDYLVHRHPLLQPENRERESPEPPADFSVEGEAKNAEQD